MYILVKIKNTVCIYDCYFIKWITNTHSYKKKKYNNTHENDVCFKFKKADGYLSKFEYMEIGYLLMPNLLLITL